MHVQAADALDLAQACRKQAKCQRVLAKIAQPWPLSPNNRSRPSVEVVPSVEEAPPRSHEWSILPGMTMFRCRLTASGQDFADWFQGMDAWGTVWFWIVVNRKSCGQVVEYFMYWWMLVQSGFFLDTAAVGRWHASIVSCQCIYVDLWKMAVPSDSRRTFINRPLMDVSLAWKKSSQVERRHQLRHMHLLAVIASSRVRHVALLTAPGIDFWDVGVSNSYCTWRKPL